MNRLTDPVLRECYLNYGHPDGPRQREPQRGIALPKRLLQDDWSTGFILAYLAVLSALIPGATLTWWFRSQSKTAHGFHESTAYRLFSAVFQHKELNFGEIITLLSGSHEVTSLIDSKLSEIYPILNTLPMVRNKNIDLEDIQVRFSICNANGSRIKWQKY